MKHVALISFILLMASGHYMRQQFPIHRPESETTGKIFFNSVELKEYYSDPAYNKPLDTMKPINYLDNLRYYYYADFLFLIAYSILFYLIARSLHSERVGKLAIKNWYKIICALILLLFLSDVGENILMLIFIESDYVNYTTWIRNLCVLKTVLLIFLVYYLIIYNLKYVVRKFYSIL